MNAAGGLAAAARPFGWTVMFLPTATQPHTSLPQHRPPSNPTSAARANSTAEAARRHPMADVFINYASFRSASDSSMEALQQATVKVVAVIAEGVPERDAKRLIAYARANSKVLIGPATVGGIQVRGGARVCVAAALEPLPASYIPSCACVLC